MFELGEAYTEAYTKHAYCKLRTAQSIPRTKPDIEDTLEQLATCPFSPLGSRRHVPE